MALRRKYGPGVTVFDPSYLGCVLVSSETEGVSAAEMIAEFEIELWDHYYARSLALQRDPNNIEP